MYNRIRIFPYKMGSEGAKKLSEALKAEGVDCLRVYSDGGYNPREGDLIVFWGAGWEPGWWRRARDLTVLNRPKAILTAIDKCAAFTAMQGMCRTVPFTFDRKTAEAWLQSGFTVCARTTAQGMDGGGLMLVNRGEYLPFAPLYTAFVKSEAEYRVHVFRGKAIIWQKKGPGRGEQILSDVIRTDANGYAFYKTDIADLPRQVLEEAEKAVSAMHLDFGGVDVLWNGEQAWVLEVNTAPAIAGTDVATYCECLKNLLTAA